MSIGFFLRVAILNNVRLDWFVEIGRYRRCRRLALGFDGRPRPRLRGLHLRQGVHDFSDKPLHPMEPVVTGKILPLEHPLDLLLKNLCIVVRVASA